MLDEHSVITQATKGHVEELAEIREVTPRRMYEQLGDQCCYSKTKLLIRDIAKVSQPGARLIKADMDALWEAVLDKKAVSDVSAVDLHREAFEAIQACLVGKSDVDKARELRELIAVAEMMLEGVNRKVLKFG